MKKRVGSILVSLAAVVAMGLAACSPPTANTPTTTAPAGTPATSTTPATTAPVSVTPSSEKPQYGGTISLGTFTNPIAFDPTKWFSGGTMTITNPTLWCGDWTKGPAGGYGSSETSWSAPYLDNIFDHMTPYAASSVKWSVDASKNEGTIVFEIRQGMHWALNQNSAASRLVGGREVTADDVVFSLNYVTHNTTADLYKADPELHPAVITKTGPWEVTATVPLAAMMAGISRLAGCTPILPPEVYNKYGNMQDWTNSVGFGPFNLTDYVSGSQVTFTRNASFWMKDPIGPGKGNQLPYLDGFQYVIIPDQSTQYAALRTGKVDLLYNVGWEDDATFQKSTPALLQVSVGSGGTKVSGTFNAIYMNTTKAPFNDVRVRQAMMMGIDFNAIDQSLAGGQGQILTFPYQYTKPYADLYIRLDDPQMPQAVKALYTYSPDKAKELLAQAGYPNGFSTTAIIPSTPSSVADYYSILAADWAKIGIDLKIEPMDPAVVQSIGASRKYDGLISNGGQCPVSNFYNATSLQGTATSNGSLIDDPTINKALNQIRTVSLTNLDDGMKLMRNLTPYVLQQAYVIPTPLAPAYNLWWPWLKNYSGEQYLGYEQAELWSAFVWLDQSLKKSMGY